MSINTEDREALRRATTVHITRSCDKEGPYWYGFCPRCGYAGKWRTEQGAVNKIAEHLMNIHHVRLVLPRKGDV